MSERRRLSSLSLTVRGAQLQHLDGEDVDFGAREVNRADDAELGALEVEGERNRPSETSETAQAILHVYPMKFSPAPSLLTSTSSET